AGGQHFATQAPGRRVPRCPGGVGVLARFLLASELAGLFVGIAGARQCYPSGLHGALELREVIARARPEGAEGAGIHDPAALYVQDADPVVEHGDGKGRVEARSVQRAAMRLRHSLLAMASELASQAFDFLLWYPAPC